MIFRRSPAAAVPEDAPVAAAMTPSGTRASGSAPPGGGLIQGRVCIVKDLSNPICCDTTRDASGVKVTLGGTHTPAVGPDHDGLFMIAAPVGRPVWRATGAIFVPSVMPWATETTIPIVPDLVYDTARGSSGNVTIAEGQGSVVVRVVRGVAPAAGVAATSALVSANTVPLYDADNSALDWRQIGPTQSAGIVWFPGVNVTTTPAPITLTPMVGTPVTLSASVETGAITFVTQDLQ